jgi:head-tail adaptor
MVTVEKKEVTQDATYGTPIVSWVPLVALPGSPVIAERFHAEVQDALPSRSEAVTQGLAVARNQSRLRMRWRDDIDSSMHVTVHKDSDTVYQIVGGPADIGGRKEHIEMVLERFSS